MKKQFRVIGSPLGHTMSPFIHKRLFALSGYDGDYSAFEISKEDLKKSFSELKELEGYNITIPHKQAIIPLLDWLDKSAEIYRSVNTVLNKNGKAVGYNTDAAGFVSALKLGGIPLKGSVLICGAGGVSRTIAIECALNNCDVTLAVRDVNSPNVLSLVGELRDRFSYPVKVVELKKVNEEYDLAVNGTPLGMYPKTEGAALCEAQLKNIKYVFDTVYNPKETKLIQMAKALGITAVSGMGMLVMQAAKAHQHWYGADFKDEDMLCLIEDTNKEMERLFK